MLTPAQLLDLNIHEWGTIEADFVHADLFLGNGFSIALDNRFTYTSIYDKFLTNLEPADRDKFAEFKQTFATTNFEFLLESLKNAYKINRILGLNTTEVTEIGIKLKNGLIKTIQEIHPEPDEEPWDDLGRISRVMDQFNNLYTLNYDTFLYNIIMLNKDRYSDGEIEHPFQDYYWGKQHVGWLEFMNYQNYDFYRHVYYLHGALFLFRNGGANFKIKKRGRNLIEAITQEVRTKQFPIFVAEGNDADKMKTINSDRYLRFCYDKLVAANNKIVIYGASLGDSDNHILTALKTRKPNLAATQRDLAISIYIGERTANDIRGDRLHFEAKFNGYLGDIKFFASHTLM